MSFVLALSAIPASAPAAHAATVPALDHVFVVVMENHSYSEIIGSSAAPYVNSLAASGALATNYYGVAHPSLPNYLALAGGSTFGISSDCTTCWVSASNIGDTVEAAGKRWKAYEESMPSACFVGDSSPYAQKHDPFIYFNDIRTNSSRCTSHVVPYSQLASDLASTSTTPNYAFITPNMCNDMHDCSVATGDAWLKQQIPTILGSPAFRTQKSVLALTWDEDDSSSSNHVPLIFVGSGITAGTRSALGYNHYSLLRTTENALGLSTLTTIDAGAAPMSDMFSGSVGPSVAPCVGASLSMNPASSATAGAVVTATGATGGCVNHVYRFWELDPGSRWSMVQNYSASSTYRWSSPRTAGTYKFEVDVRDAAETTAYDAVATAGYVLQGGSGCTLAGLTAGPASPGATAVAVTMGGSSSTCPNPVYRFWVKDPGSRWSMVQNYSASVSHLWGQTGLAGGYSLEVDVRDASGTTSYDSVANLTYQVNGCTAAGLNTNLSGPQPRGTQISLSGSATCPGTPTYRFWVKAPNGSWQIVRDFATTNTFSWNPGTAGLYSLEVDVRDQNATATYERVSNILYTIN